MNIALLGYGKMGKSIEAIALNRKHSICLRISDPVDEFNFSNCDVAIDFSVPSAAETNIKKALDANIPVISGTTGWLHKYDSVVDYCIAKDGTFLYASNFSLGVNIFFEINKKLSKMMSGHKDYSVSMEEIHHTQKLDAPSGTAISLADEIIKNSDYDGWVLKNSVKNKITIEAKRIEGVAGTHEISYDSEIDSIKIKHTAHNRKGFALGAVIAAEWIKDKRGVFTMKDVLNIG